MKPLALIIFCSINLFTQTKKQHYFYEKLYEQTHFIAECKNKNEREELERFGRILPKIAGQCEWGSNGCPVKLSKPVYPEAAQRNGFFGVVKVEIIIDETGKVVFAKAFYGNKTFYANAETAAWHSSFYPLILCKKAVWQRKIILYNFLPVY